MPRRAGRASVPRAQRARAFRLGQENPAFRKLFATMFVPDASEEQVRWFSDLMRITSEPDIAAHIFESAANIDIVDRLASVTVPTLVIHSKDDARVPFSMGRELATGIPGARFVTLESRNHILLESEPAWARFCSAFDDSSGAPLRKAVTRRGKHPSASSLRASSTFCATWRAA